MSYPPTDEQLKTAVETFRDRYGFRQGDAEWIARAVFVAVGPSIAAAERERMGQRALDPTVGIPFDDDHDVATVSAWITDPIHEQEAR